MTTEELLTSIDVQILHAPPFAHGGYTKLLLALRAVVELHQPDQSGLCEWCTCRDCTHMVSYPCKTIQKIEKELA